MKEATILMKFNNNNELKFVVEGNVYQELQVKDTELQNKINMLISRSDTANFLIRLNGAFDLDNLLQVAFENAVNKEFSRYYTDKVDKKE